MHTSNGRVLGPFGGTGGVEFDTGDWSRFLQLVKFKSKIGFRFKMFSFNRSGCSLGFISGWADQRLDSITFHWRCPRAPQQVV